MSERSTDAVRRQYERHPYPPLPIWALPAPGQGETLGVCPQGGRILVAGAGTFEALVAAQANPWAREVVAVDLSAASLARLRVRAAWAATTSLGWLGRSRPKLRCIRADLRDWEGGAFDLILASNVLHHVADPAALLARLAGWLAPKGALRVVTYPFMSRVWMRETSRWLRRQGLEAGQPALARRSREAVAQLPSTHPVRSCFVSQPERFTDAGVADAFFHPLENPLAPLEWKSACERAGLALTREEQRETSSSSFLDGLAPELRMLDAWAKLQVLDDLLELCSNPVLWFHKTDGAGAPMPAPWICRSPVAAAEISAALERVRAVAAPCGLSLIELHRRLRERVGSRTDEKGRPLPGLALADYEPAEFLPELPARL